MNMMKTFEALSFVAVINQCRYSVLYTLAFSFFLNTKFVKYDAHGEKYKEDAKSTSY